MREFRRSTASLDAELDAQKSEAIARVQEAAGAVRLRYVTDLPGQEMIYREKLAEAISYVALPVEPENPTDFPFIAAEIGITAATPYEVAQIFLNKAGLWKAIGAALETARLQAVSDVEAAGDVTGIAAAEAAYTATLLGME